MKYPRILIWLLTTSILTIGCRNDDVPDVPQPGAWTVSVLGGSAAEVDDEGEVTFGQRATYGSLRIELNGYDAERDGKVNVSCTDADWLTIDYDTLDADGILSLATQDNDIDLRRQATIVFTSTNYPSLTARLTVTQLSKADGDTNGDEAKEQLYVGYGYDIYKALDNPMAVRTKKPILNYESLVKSGHSTSYETVHDSHLSRTEMIYVASKSLYEYAEDLTRQQTKSDEYTVPGCKSDCEQAAGLGEGADRTMQNYGRGSLMKLVHARVIDKAALYHLRSQGHMPFASDFSKRFLAIQNAQGDTRKQLVTQLLEEYGTHLILQADLGGRIDYTFTMQKSGIVYAQDEMVEEAKYTMGQIAKEDRNDSYSQETSSSKSASGAIKVIGGGTTIRNQLKNDINKLTKTSQIPPEHITEWLASINYTEDALRTGDIDVVHFELEPLWNLVPDNLRQLFLEVTLSMAERSDCKVRDDILGTDLYTIDCTRKDLFDFSRVGESGSLCRLLFLKSGEENTQMPVLQVCSEYVPKIRTDQRVTVIYPIYKQKIRLNEGLFIGDGIHQPAYVGFGGSDCFIAPISTMKTTDIIKQVSYINGSLSVDPPGVKFISEDQRNRNVQDDFLYLYASDDKSFSTHRHPIVKIGSKFWTRHDIDHRMYFASGATGASTDQMEGGILYTRFEWEPNNVFMGSNSWTWGYEPNTFFANNPNTKWYLPFADDIKELQAYLGFNPKALFKGQVSGWDAAFNGYYGMSDLKNQNRLFSGGQRAMHYKGELNIICSRNNTQERNACLLVLHPDYTIQLIDDTSFRNSYRYEWRNNFYPVRAIRGYMFEYPTLATIKKNVK